MMESAKKDMEKRIDDNKEKKASIKKRYYKKTAKEIYKEAREQFNDPKVIPADNYEQDLINSLFENNKEETKDPEVVKNDVIEIKHRSGEWDFTIDDEIEYFDPLCSYELTGYRPIDETHGLDFDPEPFCAIGKIYAETGYYTEYPKDSKPYADFWIEQLNRCKNGYQVGKYRITGDHYFFLNFYRMPVVDDSKKITEASGEGFPRFVAEQYKFFHYFEMSELLKKDVVALKSRGIGWSEIGADLGVRPFITERDFNSTYITSALNYLEPTLDKCWTQLHFLNGETNGGFRRPMMKINNALHKRTSKVNAEGREWGRMNNIEGIVADNINKVRGIRSSRLFWEEAGSFKNLETAWIKGEALVTVAGARKGIMSAWGCVCKGTKVFKADGTLCNIEDIDKSTGILGFNGSGGNVEDVTYIQPTGYKQCLHIKTSLGGELKCSVDHPLLVMQKCSDGKLSNRCTFRRAYELKEGDVLLMANTIGQFGQIHEPDAYLLGMLFGDGSYTKNSCVTLSVTTNEVFEWLNSKYNISLNKLSNSSEGIYAQVYFRGIKPLLEKYGMYNKSRDMKTLPNSIWQWDKESICDFIGGYFESDGNVQIIKNKHRSIKLTSKYRQNLEKIQYLLLKVGINSSILKEVKKTNGILHSTVNNNDYNVNLEHTCYVLYINNSYYINKFKSLIKFKSLYKQNRLDSYTCKSEVSIYNNLQFVLSDNHKGEYFVGKSISNVQGVVIKKIEDIGINRIYNLTANSTHTYITNRFISANTGGDSDASALAGLSKMFNDPKAYNVLPYKNNYSEDGTVQYTGYFIPAYNIMLKSGYYDKRGVTDTKKAKEYYENERKKKSGQNLLDYCAEFCFTPNEALLKQGDGIFDPVLIADRLTQLRIQKVGVKPQQVKLFWDCPNADNNNRNKVKLIPDTTGKVFIYEPPILDENNQPYRNLYVAGIDSIDQGVNDSSTNTDVSDFCIVIKKRVLGTSSPNYVALYKDRPKDIVTAYENAMKLLVYYNCKAMLEHTKIGIIMYFRSKKKDNLFMLRPRSTLTDIKGGNSKMIGYPAVETYLRHGIELINLFLNENCYSMQIDEMLEQLLKYSWENKRKFDIVAAMIAAELGDEDLMGLSPKVQNEIQKTWRDVGWYYDMYGRKRYGVIPK